MLPIARLVHIPTCSCVPMWPFQVMTKFDPKAEASDGFRFHAVSLEIVPSDLVTITDI